MRSILACLALSAALSLIGGPLAHADEAPPCTSTATGDLRLHTLKSTIFGNERTIRVLLPDGYDAPAIGDRRYPVLYMLDGQNVFDACLSLMLAGGVTNAQLFACAGSALVELRRTDAHWSTRITLRDAGRGRFETGNFPESNVMGYRIRVVREGDAPRAVLHVRAAGPYFADLGADDAMRALKKSLTACLGPARPAG